MDRHEAEWLKRIRGKDVVGILRKAGMPCIGTRNYIPVFEAGYEPDVERVWEQLSGGGSDGRTSESPTPTVKRGRGRPPGAKNKRKS